MHANAPRPDAESLAPSGSAGRVAKRPSLSSYQEVASDTRAHLGKICALRSSDEAAVATLLANGHLGLALLCAGPLGVPVRVLRHAARAYEEKGWLLLAGEAYREAGDLDDVERIAQALRSDGLMHDAAALLPTTDD